MFKNSDDEVEFRRVLEAYKEEFGVHELTLSFPQCVSDFVEDYCSGAAIHFWKRNRYQIRVKDKSAKFFMTPKD